MTRDHYAFYFVFLVCSTLSVLAQSREEPEEPDFFFLTGGPYTQGHHSPQIIWANEWSHSNTQSGHFRDFLGAGRFEFGITSRLEADFEFGGQWTRHEPLMGPVLTESTTESVMAGVRYRLLKEDWAPLTLTIGPQLIIPSDRTVPDTGLGYGVDITAAKDWGGPVFVAGSFNWRETPSGIHEGMVVSEWLTDRSFAVALGLRPLERETAVGTKHDIHLFVEGLLTWEDGIEEGAVDRATGRFLAPGFRYGFVSRSGMLTEVGVSVPIGLGRETPDWGAVLQLQLELPTVF